MSRKEIKYDTGFKLGNLPMFDKQFEQIFGSSGTTTAHTSSDMKGIEQMKNRTRQGGQVNASQR